MPLKKNPHVASVDQVRITREGNAAVIEYADDAVATTRFTIGAKKLAAMTDEQVLDMWNESIAAREEYARGLTYTATEIPAGNPQLEFLEEADQWVPRGHVVRCQVLSDAAIPPALDEPFISIDGRDFTLAEFMTMVGTFGGWGMRIEFVHASELHQRPKLRVGGPTKRRGARTRRKR